MKYNQLQCFGIYALLASTALWTISQLSTVNVFLFQAGLGLLGWLTWTFIEYIVHRFWMHGPGMGEIFNHLHHHSHPTEINVTTVQRVLLVGSCVALQVTAWRLQNYFSLVSGFYAGFAGYFFVHALLHKKWFGKICPRLQRFHILHHCKLPHHCFGVTVHWWDYIFNTTPPKKQSPGDRIVQFYFTGKKQAMSLLLFALSGTSCTHYYYGPNTTNIPLLKEKHDGKLNFNYFVTDEASGVEFQGAYAAGKKTAVMLNFINLNDEGDFLRWGNGTREATGSATYVEAGLGYFSQLRPTRWVFETYAGLGTGSVLNTHYDLQRSKIGITKLFVQPSIGWASKGFEFGISTRLAYVNLNVKSSNVSEFNNSEDYFDIEYIRSHRSGLLLEPGLMLRAGGRRIKCSLNFTGSYNFSHHWKQEEAGISFGLSIPFNTNPGRH